MPYQPEVFPEDPKLVPEYLRRQLELIAANLTMVSGIQLDELKVVPGKPRTGMIVLADGTNWNPGEGQGIYAYYGSAWHRLPPKALGQTTSLGANVALNNTANFFNGPNTGSIGASGELWAIWGQATVTDTTGSANFALQIYNGSVALQRVYSSNVAANLNLNMSLGVIVSLSAPTTFTLQARDFTTASGTLFANDGVISTTAISAMRL